MFFLSTPSLSVAAGFAKVGTFGFLWEGLYNGTRQTSMGSSDIAGAQGPSALFLNTAPLPAATAAEVEYGRAQFVSDVDFEILGASVVWKGVRLAFTRQEMLIGPQLVRTAYEPDGTGEVFEVTSRESITGLSYDIGRLVDSSGHLSWTIGGATRWYSETVASSEVSDRTYDLGSSLAWRTDFGRAWFALKGGASWMNVTDKKIEFDEREALLPQSRHAGITAESVLNSESNGTELLRLVVAYAKTSHRDFYPEDLDHFGVEVMALGMLAVRSGRNSRFDESGSWGVGAVLNRPFMGPFVLKVDYGKYDSGFGKREMWTLSGQYRF